MSSGEPYGLLLLLLTNALLIVLMDGPWQEVPAISSQQKSYLLFTEADHSVQFCHSLDSTLAEVNTEVENAIVVALAEEALAIDNNIVCDFWMGGVSTEDGTWRWQSGDPMDCTNWCEHCPDTGKKGQDCSQLLQNGNPGTLDTFYCARETINGSGNGSRSENGVICEKNLDK